MLVYKKTFKNILFKDNNIPIEDHFFASQNEAIVADGVTRDFVGLDDYTNIPYEERLKHYPNPSGADIASIEACLTFAKTEGNLEEKLTKCNKAIKRLNDRYVPTCDYLEKDYFGAVVSCIQIEDNILHFAYLCDCGLIVYDKNGNIRVQSVDDKRKVSDPLIRRIGYSFSTPEGRAIVRKDFRNNPKNIIDGRCVSYGELTGEESALRFIKYGNVQLEEGDRVIIYSDGFYSYLRESDFIDQIINFNEERFEKYIEDKTQIDEEEFGLEKTIVLYKI